MSMKKIKMFPFLFKAWRLVRIKKKKKVTTCYRKKKNKTNQLRHTNKQK